MKTCTVCKKEKDLDEFYNYKASKDGKAYRCKGCDSKARKAWHENNKESAAKSNRKNVLWTKYRMTIEQYDAILAEQGGVCAICGGTQEKRLSVDHDHDTMRIRGLLCNQCNRGLGMLGDSVVTIQSAIDYLAER